MFKPNTSLNHTLLKPKVISLCRQYRARPACKSHRHFERGAQNASKIQICQSKHLY
jgi:hypothetical protein